MTKRKNLPGKQMRQDAVASYEVLLGDIVDLLDTARRATVRSVNTIMTTTYWMIGRRIVEQEQHGAERAGYGKALVAQLSDDLTKQFGRGFGERNLQLMRWFYVTYRDISQTVSAESSDLIGSTLAARFPLPWSHYVKLLTIQDIEARSFYEKEALRCGWSVRQLDRQIASRFYERALLSKSKAALLEKGAQPSAEDIVRPEDEIKDPFVLEFLDLKDEYSESDLESALIA